MALSKIQSESINLADDFAGMRFGGTASDNALDDYEEGTWTPTYDTGFPGGTPEEVNKGCKYTKVGNIVHISGRIQARNDGTNMALGGLPFAVSSTSPCFPECSTAQRCQ